MKIRGGKGHPRKDRKQGYEPSAEEKKCVRVCEIDVLIGELLCSGKTLIQPSLGRGHGASFSLAERKGTLHPSRSPLPRLEG